MLTALRLLNPVSVAERHVRHFNTDIRGKVLIQREAKEPYREWDTEEPSTIRGGIAGEIIPT
jgi:hypothetical protein